MNTRKLNDIIKRARLARVLALIVDELNSNMPLLRKEAAKKNLLKNLEEIVRSVEFKHGMCSGDLPPTDKLRELLTRADWSRFHPVDKRQLAKVPNAMHDEGFNGLDSFVACRRTPFTVFETGMCYRTYTLQQV